MSDKKFKLDFKIIIFAVIFIVAGIAAIIYFSGKEENKNLTFNNNKEIADEIVFQQGNDFYIFTFNNRTLRPLTEENYNRNYKYKQNSFFEKDNKIFYFDNIKKIEIETSLPALKNEADGEIYEDFNVILTSEDKSKAIFKITLYDKTDPNNFSAYLNGWLETSSKIIEYDIENNTWQESNLFSQAEEITGNTQLKFEKWDSQNNKLIAYNYPNIIVNETPVYVIDLANKSFIQTSKDYNSEQLGFTTFFSPSKEKFIFYDDFNEDLLLFNINNLSSPKKTIDVSFINDKEGIKKMAWSPNEQKIALALSTQIYEIDLNSENISLLQTLRTNTSEISNWSIWNYFSLTYSSSGKYLFFVDYSKDKTGDYYNLVSFNLETNKLEILKKSKEAISILNKL